ncbi:hypothetical protein J31TS4_07260 [Paenibacillus sp. J31TS4]|uniref:sporulation protein YpjB n=1 Tax=Paenibacillus sp. J31TS4 TaxID=2807195 RepID=UPI001B2CEDC6|nr:sporulation protein YpjB [Paenibacillus sp. J31TS4]GIP37446.1 hypothetical protein J31TS4_07260 [Paenibacillus sp. J31TS4]
MLVTRHGLLGGLVAVLIVAFLAGCGTMENDPIRRETAGQDSAEWTKLERLGGTAEELYQATAAGDIEAAKQTLDRLEEQVTGISYTGLTTLEGMKALTDTVEESKRVFQAVRFSGEDAGVAAVKLRLITDALTHKQSPMWLQFEGGQMEALRQLKSAAAQKLEREAIAAAASAEQKYRMIRPSLYVSREPADVEKLDSLFTHLNKLLKPAPTNYEDIQKTAAALEQEFREIFHRQRDKTAYLPVQGGDTPILWTLFMGSFIIAVLSFVAWKMFHSDKSIARVPRNKGGL